MALYEGCLDYAVQQFEKDNDENPSHGYTAGEYWNNCPKENRYMHIKEHSIAIWQTESDKNGEPGHAAYIDKIDSDGTITVKHYNWGTTPEQRDSVTTKYFSDAYYMNQEIGGRGLKFVGYVK